MDINQLLHASPDLAQSYQRRVFCIRNPELTIEQWVTSSELAADQRSIALSEWQPVLREYGWFSEHPPRISVIYSDDHLLIAAECSDDLLNDEPGRSLTDYCRSIASLVFPHINISELPLDEQPDSVISAQMKNIGDLIDECGIIFRKEAVIERLKSFSMEEIQNTLDAFNQANYTQDRIDTMVEDNRFVFLMEMFNRNGLNITFLRQLLPKIIHINLDKFSDMTIFALRDRLTHNYMHYVDSIHLDRMANQLMQHRDELLKDDLKPGATDGQKWLSLSIALAKSDTQRLANILEWPLVAKEQDRQILAHELLKRVSAKMQREHLGQMDIRDCLPQTPQILEAKREELLTVVKLMAERFSAEASLRKPATFSFFSNKHDGLIHAFVRELSGLKKLHVSTEQLKFRLLDVLHRFREQFESVGSKRAIELFNTAMEGHFPSTGLASNMTMGSS
jgi:hypothetical protein